MFVSNFDFKYFSFNPIQFPVFNSLSFLWSVGFLLLCIVLFQVVTGFLYSLNMVSMGFSSGECLFSKLYVFSEMYYGWVIVNCHGIFPSFMFILMFLHVYSVFNYCIFYFLFAWITGILLYFLFVIIVFTGYSLVGGYMGVWGVIVISEIFNFLLGSRFSEFIFSSLDVFSESLVFSIFSYHFFLGFVCLVFIYFHIFINHNIGSSVSLCSFYVNGNSFFNILLVSDFYMCTFLYGFIVYFVTFYPELFFSYDNFLEFSLFYVLEEVVVEWYVSIYFIILNLFSKLKGVLLLFLLIIFYVSVFCLKNSLMGFQTIIHCFLFTTVYCTFFCIFITYYFYGCNLFNSFLFTLIFLLYTFLYDLLFIYFLLVYFNF